jgi:hypothetical protein
MVEVLKALGIFYITNEKLEMRVMTTSHIDHGLAEVDPDSDRRLESGECVPNSTAEFQHLKSLGNEEP